MLGIYFSGTGNTRYCLERFCKKYSNNINIVSIEDKSAVNLVESNDIIVFAYPVYFSNLPKIVHDFIVLNKHIWQDKKIFIISTMALFSGDGTGCSARLFRKYGANVVFGLHLKMPDSIGDIKLLKTTLVKNKSTVEKINKKIDIVVEDLKSGKTYKNGLSLYSHILGLFGQRLWFYRQTKEYTNKLKIDANKCIGCKKCVLLCPMNNIYIKENKAVSKSECTKCYRCISNCPKKAITLLGKKVFEQPKIENYL